MTKQTTIVPAARRPWQAPRIDRLAGGSAQGGLVAIIPEGLGKGS